MAKTVLLVQGAGVLIPGRVGNWFLPVASKSLLAATKTP